MALALEEFRKRPKTPKKSLREILRVEIETADPHLTEIEPDDGKVSKIVVLVNGNDAPEWSGNEPFLRSLKREGYAAVVVDPRGIGRRRAKLSARGRAYTNPFVSVEANIAYNAFLVGESVLGLRVADVLAAVNPDISSDLLMN